MIKVYGKDGCPNCLELKTLLETNNIEFTYIDDKKELMTVASKNRIMSAPVIELNSKVVDYDTFKEFWRLLK